MSTRASLKYETNESTGQTVHLYEEVFDEDHVYLETIGLPFETSSSINLSGQGPARIGRNPATGEAIKIKAEATLKFRLSKAAKDAVVPEE